MTDETTLHPGTPPRDCDLCPRLAAYRAEQIVRHAGWWNAPVPPLGGAGAWLAIVGLAPGLKGANRTGKPFHGDEAGKMLFGTLAALGLATETPEGWDAPGLFITNAVACAPPGNLPETAEKHNCRSFLTEQLAALPQLNVVVALGEPSVPLTCWASAAPLPRPATAGTRQKASARSFLNMISFLPVFTRNGPAAAPHHASTSWAM